MYSLINIDGTLAVPVINKKCHGQFYSVPASIFVIQHACTVLIFRLYLNLSISERVTLFPESQVLHIQVYDKCMPQLFFPSCFFSYVYRLLLKKVFYLKKNRSNKIVSFY